MIRPGPTSMARVPALATLASMLPRFSPTTTLPGSFSASAIWCPRAHFLPMSMTSVPSLLTAPEALREIRRLHAPAIDDHATAAPEVPPAAAMLCVLHACPQSPWWRFRAAALIFACATIQQAKSGWPSATRTGRLGDEGWWNVAARGCETLLRGELAARFYYIYAVDYDRGGEWSGQAFMCTRDKEFNPRHGELPSPRL